MAQLPLREMDAALLTVALLREVDDPDGSLRRATELASFLHRGATRSLRGPLAGEDYITHPLRNTLRLVRWRVTDIDVLVASVLHDTVEDAAAEMLALANLKVPADPAEAMAVALREVVAPTFGARVAGIVAGVTNPVAPAGASHAERAEAYRRHVLQAVRADQSALIVKTSDLIDNAGSLHHHPHDALDAVQRRARKYLPVLGPVRQELHRVRPFDAAVLAAVVDDLHTIERGLRALVVPPAPSAQLARSTEQSTRAKR